MSESERPPKNKKIVRNVIYSFLVYCGSFYIFIAVLEPSVLTHPSFNPQLTVKGLLAVGLSIAVAVVFYMWFAKRTKTTKADK